MASKSFLEASRKSIAMGPCVRNLLNHYGINSSQINSTGPHQTILKSDVLSYITQNKLQPGSSQKIDISQAGKSKTFSPNLDFSGHQPKPGPEGFSKIAKEILGM